MDIENIREKKRNCLKRHIGTASARLTKSEYEAIKKEKSNYANSALQIWKTLKSQTGNPQEQYETLLLDFALYINILRYEANQFLTAQREKKEIKEKLQEVTQLLNHFKADSKETIEELAQKELEKLKYELDRENAMIIFNTKRELGMQIVDLNRELAKKDEEIEKQKAINEKWKAMFTEQAIANAKLINGE